MPEKTKNRVRLEPKILRNPEITVRFRRNPKEPKKLKGTIKNPDKPLGALCDTYLRNQDGWTNE